MRFLAPKDKRIAIDQQRLKQADLQFSSQTRLRFNLIVSYLLAATFVFLPAIPPVVGRARSTGMRHVPLAFSSQPAEQRLVLIGGGHAHVQVIKALNHASRPKHLKVTLIDVQRSATYSGMVPGTIAGVYTQEETLLDLEALAQWAKIDFLHSRVVDIDVDNKEVYLEPANTSSGEGIPSESIPSISFDAISIDIGSNSRGFHQAKGAASYAIPTRPIADLVNRLDVVSTTLQQRQKQFFPPTSNQETTQVVVIGGGTAGLELSMSIRGRWNPLIQDREDPTNGESPLKVTVLDSGNELLPGESAINRQVFRSILDERGIIVRHGCEVGAVHCDYVELTGGERVPFHHCIWATGAGAHDLAYRLGERGLAVSSRGWIEVNPHLQSITHPHVFAAGDCCTIEGLKNGQPSPPKAGVFAVRSGPVLIENLTRFLHAIETTGNSKGVELETFTPQEDFLKLIVCGDGTALGFRFGIPIYGKWVFDLKHTIDMNFMDLFRRELLPDLVEGDSYDTSQYDEKEASVFVKIPAQDAAELLQRSDDGVDFKQAWAVLRAMNADPEYRQEVLARIKAGVGNMRLQAFED